MAENGRPPIEVELWVCETCLEMGVETVGKLPQGRGSKFVSFCVGPKGQDHKQRKMTLIPFIENRATSGVGFPE